MSHREILRKSHIKSSAVPPTSGIVLLWLDILSFPCSLQCLVVGFGEGGRHCWPQESSWFPFWFNCQLPLPPV